MKKLILSSIAVLACSLSMGQSISKASKSTSPALNNNSKTPLQTASSIDVAQMSEGEFIATFFVDGVLPNSFTPYDPNLPLEDKKNIMRAWLKNNPEFKK